MSKILVTGAAGFIGFHVSKKLIDLGFEVYGIDNLNAYYDVRLKLDRLKELGIDIQSELFMRQQEVKSGSNESFRFSQMDLVDEHRLDHLFLKEKFDAVINLAAQAGVRYSIENPKAYIQANVVGFMNILEACRSNQIKHLIYASSSSVYGNQQKVPFSEKDRVISDQIIKEIKNRLEFLVNVGLDYLNLSRNSGTLSGGESQRIRLATQIGSALMGVLYILDEPSIGLHQRDNDKLIQTLKNLRDVGNTVIVVEHDEATMREADFIVDIGPRAGEHGGQIIAAGPVEEIMACKESITGQYLTGEKKVELPAERRKGNGKLIPNKNYKC